MPEAFEFSDEALGFAFRISSLLVVVGAEVLEDLAGGEEVPDHVGEAVSDGHGCLVGTTAGCDLAVLGTEVAGLGLRGSP